ncbi:MAG: TonB-dependent receptor [Bacteroidetes bacterium]|nr:TonB-dependent receptor [Bacteroidota bacterium]
MLKLYSKAVIPLIILTVITANLCAQTSISGTVTDGGTKETLAGVNVVVKGKVIGTITNVNGEYNLKVNQEPPFTLVYSFIGFRTQEIEIKDANTTGLNVTLEEETLLGQEVVVSASRVEESILQSPVSVEKMDILSIKNVAAPSFYDAIGNLKGVDMSVQSLTFRSVNVRGFGANGNTRVVQLIDGMDNQAPGLNFSVGNIVGMSELDLESTELIPGAASALYGPNAINGILLMNSKSPFQYQGLSANVKTGIMDEKNRTTPTTPFYDASIRYAKAFNNKFAFKVNLSYLKADDWQANDYRDQSLLNGSSLESGNRTNNQAYNGINSYGDETNVNMYSSLFANGTPGNGTGGTSPFLGFIATNAINTPFGARTLPQLTGLTPQQLFAQLFPSASTASVSRLGYNENLLADYGTKSLKTNLSLHYRINDKVEVILQGNYGTGTTVYTGADRYSIKDFSIGQYKLEFKGDNFFVRGYTTQERSGDSYSIGTLASLVNEAWKPSSAWYPQFFQTFGGASYQTYATALLTALGGGAPLPTALTTAQSAVSNNFGAFYDVARNAADQGRLLPGTDAFNSKVAELKGIPIASGAKFNDKTNLYHFEGMYNFKNQIKFAEVIVGANYRNYALNSGQTIFALDNDGKEFSIDEYGGYLQASKRVLNENLKLTGSIRYDKNMNFDGQFSPRISAVYTAAKTHNFRVSYQTGFRIPTTQDQYIDLKTPQARLLGGLKLLRDRYGLEGTSYTLQSVQANPTNPANWQLYQFKDFQPERVRTYEIGYKGLIANKLLIDAYYYFNDFINFIGSQVLLKPSTAPGQFDTFSLPVNVSNSIKSNGWALGVDYSLPKNFTIGGNVAYNSLTNENELPQGFLPQYNTPKYRYNVTLGNRELFKNFGFSAVWRYQDAYVWQSSFAGPAVQTANRSIIPSFSTLDAQFSYKVPSIKSVFKIGGSNILNQGYVASWGNPTVGAMYYVSITFDEFLR